MDDLAQAVATVWRRLVAMRGDVRIDEPNRAGDLLELIEGLEREFPTETKAERARLGLSPTPRAGGRDDG